MASREYLMQLVGKSSVDEDDDAASSSSSTNDSSSSSLSSSSSSSVSSEIDDDDDDDIASSTVEMMPTDDARDEDDEDDDDEEDDNMMEAEQQSQEEEDDDDNEEKVDEEEEKDEAGEKSDLSAGTPKMRIKLSLRVSGSKDGSISSSSKGKNKEKDLSTAIRGAGEVISKEGKTKARSLPKKKRFVPPITAAKLKEDEDEDEDHAVAAVVHENDIDDDHAVASVVEVVASDSKDAAALAKAAKTDAAKISSKAKVKKRKAISSAEPSTVTSAPSAIRSSAAISPTPSGSSAANQQATGRHRHHTYTRPVRLPPINSPGLLMTTSAAGAAAVAAAQQQQQLEGKGVTPDAAPSSSSPAIFTTGGGTYVSPSVVFDHVMSIAGYTTENRTEHPHRGSSVRRTVDDMFDSDVMLSFNFPELVPEELLGRPKAWKKEGTENGDGNQKEQGRKEKEEGGAHRHEDESNSGETLPKILLSALERLLNSTSDSSSTDGTKKHGVDTEDRKHREASDDRNNRNNRTFLRKTSAGQGTRPFQFMDMVPISLTTQYPESYIARRVKYVKEVEARERAIIASQEAEEAADEVKERYEEAKEEWANKVSEYHAKKEKKSRKEGEDADEDEDGSESGPPPMPVPPPIPAPIHVPPIPVPPSPPTLSEMGLKAAEEDDEGNAEHDEIATEETDGPSSKKKTSKMTKGQRVIYIPSGKEHVVTHLDPSCFHVTEGRYFGLFSNHIADPQFVGPNAPGIAGLNVSGGTGLATSYVGSSSGGGGGGMTASQSSSYYTGASVAGVNSATGGGVSAAISTKSVASGGGAGTGGGGGSGVAKGVKKSSSSGGAIKSSGPGPPPSATSLDLKRLMERGGEDAERMRMTIIRAAVHASRSGAHGGSFVGSDGEIYPDVSKAFAMHAGLRPCNRCKSNKQGAYHCRLRRKHKDIDYDGGDSRAILAPLFEEPMDSLLLRSGSSSTGTGS